MFAVIAVIVILVGVGVIGAIISEHNTKRMESQEWERTCQRCGNVWYLSQQAARESAPSQGEMMSAKMYRAGKRASLFTTRASAAELQVHNLEARKARVVARDQCPECGSTSIRQQLVPTQH